MEHHLILRIATKLLIPMILLFALYVQFHGDFGPGGGFQAGVIFGAGLILYGIVFGVDSLMAAIPLKSVRVVAALGLILYAGVGVFSLMQGANFLDYDALAEDPLHGQHYGILLIELGVGMTVAATMVGLFCSFSAGRRDPDDHVDAEHDS